MVLKFAVALSIFNVWLIQTHKPTRWRGGDAKTITQEFKVYGLSENMCYAIGFLKVALSALLLFSIGFSGLTLYASLGLAALLLGSILMHFKIKDPLYKSFPAALFLVFNLIIAYSAY